MNEETTDEPQHDDRHDAHRQGIIMTRLSNLPPGCTDADIERAAGGDDEDRDEAYGAAMARHDLPDDPTCPECGDELCFGECRERPRHEENRGAMP